MLGLIWPAFWFAGCGQSNQTQTSPLDKSASSHLSPIELIALGAEIIAITPGQDYCKKDTVNILNPMAGEYYVHLVYDPSVAVPMATIGIRIDGSVQIWIPIIVGNETRQIIEPYTFILTAGVEKKAK